MSILSELAGDLPTTTAEVVARERGSKVDEPTGESFTVAYMDMPGAEQADRGITASTRVLKVFANLKDGAPPFTMKTRLRIEGEDWNVVSIQRIPDRDWAGVLAVCKANL